MPSLEELVQTHGRFLYTVAYRLTGNHDDAEDLVQEVLVRVQRGLGTYRPGSLEGWLGRIATNAYVDEVRRRRRRPAQVDAPDLERHGPLAPSPDEELAAAGLPDEVQAALDALPEEYRVAVVLCDIADLRYEDIAEALDIPVGTVRSRIHRGRALLREALAR